MVGFRWQRNAVAAACAVGMVCSGLARGAEFQVDPVHSSVLFRIKHMNTSYTWGRFNEMSGAARLDADDPALDVTVKAASIDTGNEKRDQHLKGPDFFNVKQFADIAFASNKLVKVDDENYELEGTLTLHGTERPIKVVLERTGTAKNPLGKTITGLATEFTVKRSDFGMDFALQGASDEVLVIVALECIQQ